MQTKDLLERELINGKPYGGKLFGKAAFFGHEFSIGSVDYEMIKERLYLGLPPKNLELRHDTLIFRPPCTFANITQNGSLGLRYMLWGRAFEVRQLEKKGIRRYKRKMINGKRKFVRIDIR